MKMKVLKILCTLFVVLFVIGCGSQQQQTPTISSEDLRIAEIALPGMFCQSCAQSSETAFESMPGVVDANIDIVTKKGNVIYDSSAISKEQLVEEGLIQAYDGSVINDQKYEE